MGERCRWCGRALPDRARTGRQRRFCRDGCRQQAYLDRKLAAAHGLGDNDVIVDRQRLEGLQDGLYCLQAAIEDVDADLAAQPDPEELHRVLGWLLDNARPVAGSGSNPGPLL